MDIQCDGDLLSIFCLNKDGQKLLKDFELTKVPHLEDKWLQDYAWKEYTTTEKLHINNPEKHVYKLFKVSCQYDNTGKGNPANYPQYLFNAMVAKGNIGFATIDLWALYAIFECYQAYCVKHNYRYIKNGRDNGPLAQVLTNEDKEKLAFTHVMLVQGNVIEAVKHSEGGSQAFSKYYLDGMTEKSNIDYIRKELTIEYGLSVEEANKMLYIVQWAKETDLLIAVKNFITKYNKGKIPPEPKYLDMWEQFIYESTYFGNLMEPIFSIKQNIDEMNAQVKKQTEQLMQQNAKSLFENIQIDGIEQKSEEESFTKVLNEIPSFNF